MEEMNVRPAYPKTSPFEPDKGASSHVQRMDGRRLWVDSVIVVRWFFNLKSVPASTFEGTALLVDHGPHPRVSKQPAALPIGRLPGAGKVQSRLYPARLRVWYICLIFCGPS